MIRTSKVSIEEIDALTHKVEILVDSLNSKRGAVGMLINDPELGRKISQIASNLETVTAAIAEGKGSLGKLIADDTLYTRANDAVDRLGQDHQKSKRGQGNRRQADNGRLAL